MANANQLLGYITKFRLVKLFASIPNVYFFSMFYLYTCLTNQTLAEMLNTAVNRIKRVKRLQYDHSKRRLQFLYIIDLILKQLWSNYWNYKTWTSNSLWYLDSVLNSDQNPLLKLPRRSNDNVSFKSLSSGINQFHFRFSFRIICF